jgi:hypothetical protein
MQPIQNGGSVARFDGQTYRSLGAGLLGGEAEGGEILNGVSPGGLSVSVSPRYATCPWEAQQPGRPATQCWSPFAGFGCWVIKI